MKIKTLGRVLLAGIMGMGSCDLPADNKQDEALANLKPLTGHIIKPRQMIDLTGTWDFHKSSATMEKYPDPKDASKQLTRWVPKKIENFNDLEWQRIRLPKTLSPSDRDQHYYRTYFGMPSDVANKRVIIKFELAVDEIQITVNGKQFERVPTYELPWDIDISSAVKPGPNEIIVQMFNGFGRRASEWAHWPQTHAWAMTGIWGLSRPVHIEIMDKVYIDWPVIQTKVSSNKVIIAKAVVKNDTDKDVKAYVDFDVRESIYRSHTRFKTPEYLIPAKGEYTFIATQKWNNAKLWDPEHPNLYHMNFSVISDKKTLDAYRQRFGFREISIVGNQFLINGMPYIHRRNGAVTGAPSIEDMKKSILQLRDLGITGQRLFGGNWTRLMEAADEAGFMVTPVAPCGNGANWKSDIFWKRLEAYQEKMIKTYINHPCVLAWALGNEFGTIYGGAEGRPEEKPGTDRQVETGRKAEKLDPTRGWTYCGELDIGYPVRGAIGPAPIRSFHYPISTCKDGITFPESGYWYANDVLPWQRITKKDKPLVISEDIFHGTTDEHVGMAKTGGDSIYTVEGYAKTLHYIIRCFAEGFYFSGLGGWHTWVTEHDRPQNMLNKFGQVIPNFLIATRENYANLRGGESVKRNVYCYNQLFTPYQCVLSREDVFKGKVVFSEKRFFLLKPGVKQHEQMTIDVPEVKKPGVYSVRYRLTTGDRLLDERTYDYNVFPKMTSVRASGGIVLVTDKDNVLNASKFSDVFYGVDEAINDKPKGIVVAKNLTTDEGRKLNDYVLAGGKVMLLEMGESSWTPITLEFKRPLSFAWRRNDDRMKGVDEKCMRAWMPDHTLGDASYPKPIADTRVLWDCGQKQGITNANVLWLARGKGAFFLCQLPVVSRFAIEPAAPHVLQEMLGEFSTKIPKISGKTVATGAMKDMLRSLSIESVEKATSDEDVLVLDASKELTGEEIAAFESHAGNGGSTIVIEPYAGTNEAFMAKLGIKVEPLKIKGLGTSWVYDNTAKWLLRKDNSGLMAGFANDSTLWYSAVGRLYGYFTKRMCGEEALWNNRRADPIATGDIIPLAGADVKILTEPAAIAECSYRGAKVLVTTLMFSKYAGSQQARCSILLRTFLNNLGAVTVTPEKVHEYKFIDMKKAFNRNFWNDPVHRKDDGTFETKGWFGDDNDFRFFPVNLCGWSLAARNFCPKEEFPKEPLNMGGRHFMIQDPMLNNGKSILHLAPGEKAKVELPSDFKAQKIYFLGVCEGRRERNRKTSTVLEVKSPAIKEPWVFKGWEHFGIARFACTIPKGNIAWSGPTMKDDQASVYYWYGENTNPNAEMKHLELENKSEIDNIIIIAITAELPDA